jgi:hypothetical protein
MPKARKSNKEAKKEPAMTMKEKRAAKKSKSETRTLLGSAEGVRRPIVVPTRRP